MRFFILVCLLALLVDSFFLKLNLRDDYNSNRFKIAPEVTCIINQSTYCYHAWKTSHRGKRFLSVRVPYTSTGTSVFQLKRQFLACGDVSSNPGPKRKANPKYPCGECYKSVTKNQDAILCTQCNIWSHAKCLNMSNATFRYYLDHPNIDWTCTTCTLPKFSDSFFMDGTSEFSVPVDLETADEAIVAEDIQKLRTNHRKQCIIANLNVNSLPNKFEEIKEWLAQKAFDILSIQETKIDRTFPNSQFHVEGFKLFRRDRVKGGGGIAVFISENIITTTRKVACTHLEALLFDLRIGQRQFALLSAYKPPSVDNNIFTNEMLKVMDQATLLSDNIICIGDLNCDILHPLHNNKQGKCLLDICDVYDLDPLINKPTRISENKSTCLDVILTNVPAFMRDSGTIETGLSDHCLVYTVLNTKLLRPRSKSILKRSLKNFDQTAFLDDLSRVPSCAAYVFEDPDDVYWCWEKLFNQVLDDHAPIKKINLRQSSGSKFITAEIRHVMRERDRFKKTFHKTRHQTDWENYRQARNRVVSMRRKAVQEHFRKVCENKGGDQRKFWSTIKPYLNSRKSTNDGRIVLKDNDVIIRDPQEVTETLNNFFTSAAREETGQAKPTPDCSHIADLSRIQQNLTPKPPLSLKKTNSIEVKEAMMKIKTNKATGCDQIPPRVIKESAEILCHPFSELFNYIVNKSRIPQQWKLGEVTPVFKKDCSLIKSNYRPITILPSLSKVFETLVHTRISPYFEDIFHEHVFAYRKHHGTDTALLSLTEQWRKELDQHKIIGIVSMDLSKAFDTLPHELLVAKLKSYGADGKTTDLVHDYLANRRQRVRLGDQFSNWKETSVGVPQGSVLGPLLFNIFMNDLVYAVKQSRLSAYADDTQIFFADSTPEKVEEVINADLARVDQWYEQNGMRRNTSKYQAIVMGKTQVKPQFHCENIAIPITEDLEMLGVTVDDKMKFEKHIAKICRKVSQQIAVLKRMKKILPFETRKCLYLAFIIPHFNYCSETWHFCNKRAIAKLEKVNERALRFVFNEKQRPYSELLDKIGLPSLENQRLAKIVCTVFNVINSEHAPKSIKELIGFRNNKYNLRGSEILKRPKASTTTYGLKSWRFTAPKLWNSLPDSSRTVRTFKAFKNSIRTLDLSGLL